MAQRVWGQWGYLDSCGSPTSPTPQRRADKPTIEARFTLAMQALPTQRGVFVISIERTHTLFNFLAQTQTGTDFSSDAKAIKWTKVIVMNMTE